MLLRCHWLELRGSTCCNGQLDVFVGEPVGGASVVVEKLCLGEYAGGVPVSEVHDLQWDLGVVFRHVLTGENQMEDTSVLRSLHIAILCNKQVVHGGDI